MGTIKSDAGADRTVRAASEVAALGRRLHDVRAARGLSLQEFAALTGLAAPVLSSLERGERSSTLSTLFAVADALGVSAQTFFDAGEKSMDAASSRVHASTEASAVPAPSGQHPITSTTPAAAGTARAPRTFADLRTGALEGRVFDTLQQFAVAAVHEARFSVAAIARVFRVPAWKLQGWVDEKDGQR